MHAQIIDHPTLYRDMESQHIVQTDMALVRKHEARMLQQRKEREQMAEIAAMKADITEIKELLHKLLIGK